MHQLPAHAAAPEGLVRRLPPRRARDHRRAHAGVRVRARRLERRRRRQAARDHVPGRPGQQVRHLERLPEPVLAGRVPDRPERAVRHMSASARASYDETEAAIRSCSAAQRTRARSPSRTPTRRRRSTPESYLGYERLDRRATSARRCSPNRLAPYTAPRLDPARLVRLHRQLARRAPADRRRDGRGAAAPLPRQGRLPRARRARARSASPSPASRRRTSTSTRTGSTRCTARHDDRATTCSSCASRPAFRRTRSRSADAAALLVAARGRALVVLPRARAGSASARRRARRPTGGRSRRSISSTRLLELVDVGRGLLVGRDGLAHLLHVGVARLVELVRVERDVEQLGRAGRRAPSPPAATASSRRSAARPPRATPTGCPAARQASWSTPTMPVGPS